VRINVIRIQIAIGIEIDPLNSDFDSEPDCDLDYPRVRTFVLFAGFKNIVMLIFVMACPLQGGLTTESFFGNSLY